MSIRRRDPAPFGRPSAAAWRRIAPPRVADPLFRHRIYGETGAPMAATPAGATRVAKNWSMAVAIAAVERSRQGRTVRRSISSLARQVAELDEDGRHVGRAAAREARLRVRLLAQRQTGSSADQRLGEAVREAARLPRGQLLRMSATVVRGLVARSRPARHRPCSRARRGRCASASEARSDRYRPWRPDARRGRDRIGVDRDEQIALAARTRDALVERKEDVAFARQRPGSGPSPRVAPEPLGEARTRSPSPARRSRRSRPDRCRRDPGR